MNKPFSIVALLICVSASQTTHAQDAPLPEVAESPIRFETVAEARQVLAQSEDVYWREENGWPVAINARERTIWSFSPPDYPAYPAVVQLQVTADGTGSAVTQSILCEARKDVCDDLVRTFADLRGLLLPE